MHSEQNISTSDQYGNHPGDDHLGHYSRRLNLDLVEQARLTDAEARLPSPVLTSDELVQVQFTTDTFNAPATLHRDCSLEAYLEDAVLPGNDLRCASTNDCGTRKPSRPRTASSYLQQPRSRS
uniref:(northern house mosquito) hypothetical protein n=1 Tax=Culex pipiens TaxID=7175 RepID=A0A8D8F7W2_CULPI